MNKPKQYSLPELFNSTSLGFVFEFYSSKKADFIVENLGSLTTKNVILTNNTKYAPSFSNAVLIREYEGKKPRYTFKLAQQRYDSIIPLMKEVLEWISTTSECKQDNLMRVNMSFDHRHLKTLHTLNKMNPQKLILKIDEEYMYDRFPSQMDSPYSMSIKQLLPMSEAQYTPDIIKNVNYVIGVPKEDYFAVNFKDFATGLLEFNYIGGVDYAEKQKEILEVVQYYIIKTYQSLNEADFTPDEVKELKALTNEFYKISEAYYEIEKFEELFPGITVAVDLRRDSQMLKSYWPKIRNTLFNTVINNNLREGQFNYDTDYGVFQIRKGTLNCTGLKNFDLVYCDVTGVMENCNFIYCEVNNARIYKSTVVKGTTISDSYLKQVTVEAHNTLEECFVDNHHEMLNCQINNSILKFAGIGSVAKLDEATVIIDDQVDQTPAVGIEVEEIRDYTFIKKMKQTKDLGFQNQYIKKTYI
jgi:hypothetical protein